MEKPGRRYAVPGFREAIDRLTDAKRTTVKAVLDTFIL
jgi:hypothetical protein